MANKTSQHILNTSANLLGFCLIILTSMHFKDATANTMIDEITSCIALLLALSSALSFLSIKVEHHYWEIQLERTADYLFMISLLGIFFIIIFIAVIYWGQ